MRTKKAKAIKKLTIRAQEAITDISGKNYPFPMGVCAITGIATTYAAMAKAILRKNV